MDEIIIFIDDDESFLNSLQRYMHKNPIDREVRYINNSALVLDQLEDDKKYIIICDWEMPGINGPKLCELIRERFIDDNENIVRPYIILFTGRIDIDSLIEGLHIGADDYISKTSDRRELIARISVGLRAIDADCKLRNANRVLTKLATTDPLTKLPNRLEGTRILSAEIARVVRNMQSLMIGLLDIDHFKSINDNYGHAAGDFVLQRAADCLTSVCRKYDVISRWGGEEFLLICPNPLHHNLQELAERILYKLELETIQLHDEETIHITASLGAINIQSGYDCNLADLLAVADENLYKAKSSGRNMVIYHELKIQK